MWPKTCQANSGVARSSGVSNVVLHNALLRWTFRRPLETNKLVHRVCSISCIIIHLSPPMSGLHLNADMKSRCQIETVYGRQRALNIHTSLQSSLPRATLYATSALLYPFLVYFPPSPPPSEMQETIRSYTSHHPSSPQSRRFVVIAAIIWEEGLL